MAVATKSSRHVLRVKKILEGDAISLLPESGGFCPCATTEDGVVLSVHGSRDIFLSEKNIYEILEHVLKGEAGTTLELDELVVEPPKAEESK